MTAVCSLGVDTDGDRHTWVLLGPCAVAEGDLVVVVSLIAFLVPTIFLVGAVLPCRLTPFVPLVAALTLAAGLQLPEVVLFFVFELLRVLSSDRRLDPAVALTHQLLLRRRLSLGQRVAALTCGRDHRPRRRERRHRRDTGDGLCLEAHAFPFEVCLFAYRTEEVTQVHWMGTQSFLGRGPNDANWSPFDPDGSPAWWRAQLEQLSSRGRGSN